MELLLQQIINGLVLGSMYALIALGYTMVYGILNLINFAHGDVLMVGALTALSTILFLQPMFVDAPGWLLLAVGVLAAIPVCITISLIIERVAYRPLRNAPRLAPLITAIGVSILLQTFAMIVWGRNFLTFPTLLDDRPIEFFGATLTTTRALVIVTSAIIMIGLMVLVNRTKLGRAMRATAENPRVAGLDGRQSKLRDRSYVCHWSRTRCRCGSDVGVDVFDRAFFHGIHAGTESVHGGCVGRHRQYPWRDAGWPAARFD